MEETEQGTSEVETIRGALNVNLAAKMSREKVSMLKGNEENKTMIE